MTNKVETYRDVDILAETFRHQSGGGIPQLTKRYDANPKTEKVHCDSLNGIKKRIDEVLDRKV